MEIVVVGALLLGLLTGAIAQKKGYSFLTWFIGGTLLAIVALPEILLKKPNRDAQQQCPHCRTWIDGQATVCAQCGRDVAVND